MGMARVVKAEVPDALHVHFDGAGGNVAAGKYNDGSPENRPILAARLAAGMKAAWESQQKVPISAGQVDWKVVPVSLPLRGELVEDSLAKGVADASLDVKARVRLARDLAWARRMKSGHEIPLACLRLGPVCIVHMPGELCVSISSRPRRCVRDCSSAWRPTATMAWGTSARRSPTRKEAMRRGACRASPRESRRC